MKRRKGEEEEEGGRGRSTRRERRRSAKSSPSETGNADVGHSTKITVTFPNPTHPLLLLLLLLNSIAMNLIPFQQYQQFRIIPD